MCVTVDDLAGKNNPWNGYQKSEEPLRGNNKKKKREKQLKAKAGICSNDSVSNDN